jgi:DNA invertase Pin-like site-specific DNA recombinase
VYTRKSTTAGLEQEFNTLDAQREACEGYIANQAYAGWRLMPERYDDGGFTGANLERPAFKRLLSDIEAGEIDIVVVYKVDRLSRSLLDFAQVMGRFQKFDVAFVSVTQNFSTADAMGRLTMNMLMSFAQFEREMIADRTRDKVAAARRRGKWTGGRVPLGYDVEAKKLVVNVLEAVIVREVFALYLQHRSALVVMRELNRRQRITKRHRAGSGRMQEGRAWTKSGVLRVLRNPVYAGLISHGKLMHEGEHEAIVDRETFERAQALLEGASGPMTDRGRNPAYLLRGLLWCAHCGGAYTPGSTRKGNREYRYYRCVTRDKQGTAACPGAPLPAGSIEDYVVDQVREVANDGGFAVELRARVEEHVSARTGELRTERRSLPAVIASVSAEASRLVDTLASTEGTAARMVQQRLEEVGSQLALHEQRLATVERQLAGLEGLRVEVGWVAQVLADWDAIWDVLSDDNRGRLVRAVVDRVDVDGPAGTVRVALADLGIEAEEAAA